MIQSDQQTCFPENILAYVSSKEDGTMLDRTQDFHVLKILQNRQNFCRNAGIDYSQCVYQLIRYDEGESFCIIRNVSDDETTTYQPDIHADALFTDQPGVGLFLPVADCIATVVYDPKNHFLALLHLGRHSTYAHLTTRVVKHFVDRGSDSKNIIVWMSPHAQKSSYNLDWFDKADDPDWSGFYEKRPDGYSIDMAGYNRKQFIKAGIPMDNIHVSSVDTATNEAYFSHSRGDKSGRIAVVAMMK